ncbi:MAG TPA: carboxypeptidase regulatory-like domain-containing protein [Candidatus Aquilonibacter sp.]|nr:carboxypeptidase regulatory-like domain-containing protein [Candidatus Aquilonibacter sp.]
MSLFSLARRLAFGGLCFALFLVAGVIQAQSGTGTLRGTVTDPSGAAVVGATVTATSSSGQATTVTSNATGAYEFRGLAAGQYQVTTNAAGFQQFQNPAVTVAAGAAKTLDIPLAIEIEQQQVQVNAESQSLSVAPENNASAIVLSGSDLDALPDDPDELQADLQALAGPSLGPNGGQMYIDGFTAGELPPKSQIREIRINSNPFSAEYDSLGYGRIEIFTKAGGGQTHGSFFVMGNSKGLNTADPYALGAVPGYDTVQYNGNIGGSLGKNTSYFITAQQRRINDAELGDLYTQSTATAQESGLAISNPRIRTQISPQIAFNPSKNNTLTIRYQYSRDHEENDGVSEFVAPTEAYNTTSYENSIQISDTQVYGANLVMDTRFQFNGEHSNQTPLSTAVNIDVPGYVNLGGYPSGFNSTTTQNYELQNYFTFTHGNHTLNFGVRWRDSQSDGTETAGSNGAFSFQNYTTFQQAELYLNEYPGEPVPTADLPYQFTQTIAPNGGFASLNMFDAGAFIQDDYKWRPNITISTGLRFESQTDIPDHRDWAPREAIAWGIGKTKTGSPAFVLRGGWGMFYNRFSTGNLLMLQRYNGIKQVSYLVTDPTVLAESFPSAPSQLTTAPGLTPTLYQLGPNFHTPYTMEAAASIEHQLTRNTTVTVNYLNGRGVKQLYTTDINAPSFASDFNLTDPADRPNGILENVNQYTSGGIFKQNVLSTSFSVRATNRLTLNGYYSLTYANATANQVMFWQDPSLDYGRATFATRDRVFVGGTLNLPYGFTLSPFVTANSGAPYNVTGSNDWTGNNLYNRPTLTTATVDNKYVFSLPGAPGTNLCNGFSSGSTCIAANGTGPALTLAQVAQELVPVNYLTGPGNFSFNLRVAKVFAFGRPREVATNQAPGQGGRGGPGGFGGGPPGGGRGPEGGGGGGRGGGGFGGGGFGGGRGGFGGRGGASNHRYTLTLSANARNLLNIVNPGTPQGSDNSPYFGKSTSLVAAGATTTYNRQISLQAIFNF